MMLWARLRRESHDGRGVGKPRLVFIGLHQMTILYFRKNLRQGWIGEEGTTTELIKL